MEGLPICFKFFYSGDDERVENVLDLRIFMNDDWIVLLHELYYLWQPKCSQLLLEHHIDLYFFLPVLFLLFLIVKLICKVLSSLFFLHYSILLL